MQETPVKYSKFFFKEGLFTLRLTLTKMDYFIKAVCQCFQKLGDLDARITVGGWWYALYMHILNCYYGHFDHRVFFKCMSQWSCHCSVLLLQKAKSGLVFSIICGLVSLSVYYTVHQQESLSLAYMAFHNILWELIGKENYSSSMLLCS